MEGVGAADFLTGQHVQSGSYFDKRVQFDDDGELGGRQREYLHQRARCLDRFIRECATPKPVVASGRSARLKRLPVMRDDASPKAKHFVIMTNVLL